MVRGLTDATTAGVRFPYTFFSLGLVLLESVSVFALNDGQLLTTSSSGGGGNASRMSLWRAPLSAAPSTGGADAVAVRIVPRADFDVLTPPAAEEAQAAARLGAPATGAAADSAFSLSATLAAAHFTAAAAASSRKPGSLSSL
jgi:hypothetical protein